MGKNVKIYKSYNTVTMLYPLQGYDEPDTIGDPDQDVNNADMPSIVCSQGYTFLAHRYNSNLVIISTDDDGDNWSSPVTIKAPAVGGWELYPNLFAGADGDLYCVWAGLEGARNQTRFSKSTDLGATWSPHVNITVEGSPAIAHLPMSAVINNNTGRIHVLVFRGAILGDGGAIQYTYSSDNGATWSTPVDLDSPVSPSQNKGDLLLNLKGELYIIALHKIDGAFYPSYRISTDHGATWSDWVKINRTTESVGVSASVDNNGTIHVAYEEISLYEPSPINVYYLNSTSEGDGWTIPVLANTCVNDAPGEYLDITADTFGRIALLWVKFETSLDSYVPSYVDSKDYGVTWSNAQTAEPAYIGDLPQYTKIAQAADGMFVLCSQLQGNNRDPYLFMYYIRLWFGDPTTTNVPKFKQNFDDPISISPNNSYNGNDPEITWYGTSIIGCYIKSGEAVKIIKSTDSGATFTETTLVSTTYTIDNCRIAASSTRIFESHNEAVSGNGECSFSYSEDGGDTWDTQIIADNGVDGEVTSTVHDVLYNRASESDVMVITRSVLDLGDGLNTGIYINRSDDSGETWEGWALLVDGNNVIGVKTFVDSSGYIYLVYANNVTDEAGRVNYAPFYMKSTDWGNSFSAAVQFSKQISYVSTVVYDEINQRVYCFYMTKNGQVWMVYTEDDGTTWSPEIPITKETGIDSSLAINATLSGGVNVGYYSGNQLDINLGNKVMINGIAYQIVNTNEASGGNYIWNYFADNELVSSPEAPQSDSPYLLMHRLVDLSFRLYFVVNNDLNQSITLANFPDSSTVYEERLSPVMIRIVYTYIPKSSVVRAVYYIESNDKGVSWSTPVKISSGEVNIGGHNGDYSPQILMIGDDSAICMYYGHTNGYTKQMIRYALTNPRLPSKSDTEQSTYGQDLNLQPREPRKAKQVFTPHVSWRTVPRIRYRSLDSWKKRGAKYARHGASWVRTNS